MRTWIAGVMVAIAGLNSAVQAGDQPVVIELYTSQGCSACPPADELMSKLAERTDVIALALHVDYWDYIGWKDQFADPAYTKRQKQYAHAAGERMIYTPQLIVGGRDHVVGYRPMELAELIQTHKAMPDSLELRATRVGDRVRVQASVMGVVPKAMVVQIARFTASETVDIKQGENAGHTFVYVNVVHDWATVGEWDGAAPLDLDIAAPDGPAAVIIQQAGMGPIVAAARLD